MVENRYVSTKEHVKEMYAYSQLKNPISIFLMASLAVLWVIELALCIWLQQFPVYSVVFLIAAPIVIGLWVFSYFKAVKLHIKREQELYGGAREIVVTADDDTFNFCPGGENRKSLYYSQIKKVRRTKNLIIVISDANLMYVLRKDSFTQGNEEKFYDILGENRVNFK